jgi:cytoskeletal protein CcmA (bactofilin family)
MFSKGSKAGARNATPSIIGADCTLTGDLLSQGELHIDGRVDGDIRCNVLVVGESGVITGEISAETVRVLGSVTGQIAARVVTLAKTARVVGDIRHDSLSVEAGAYVEGRFDRLPADPPPKAVEKPADLPALPIRSLSAQAAMVSNVAPMNIEQQIAATEDDDPGTAVILLGN